MSRPSCYNCQFTDISRVADISLGDLWGVHIYCPDLYGNNLGASLIVCNTEKGKQVLELSKKFLYGRELDFEVAKKYQSPLRKSIEKNPKREEFLKDLENPNIKYKKLIKKWYKHPNVKLFCSKYIWGNRQKVFFWNFKKIIWRK